MPNPSKGRARGTDTETQREGNGRGRQTGILRLHAKECQGLLVAIGSDESHRADSPSGPQREPTLPTI